MREGWKEERLGDLTSKIGSGVTPRGGSSVYINSGTTLIRSQNIYNGYFDKGGLVYINDETAQKMSNVELIEDDVLINITGDSVARCTTVPKNILPARINQHVSILRCIKERINPKFLKYTLISPYYQAVLLSIATGAGATRNALTKSILEDFKINLPPLPTQQRIAELLSGYDDLIENNLKRIKILEEMAQQTYEEWFVRMRFPGYESAVINPETGLPKGWEKVKLGEISDFKYGSMQKKENIVDSGYPVFSGYRNTGFSSKYNVSKKSLIVVARGVGGTGDVKFTPQKCWLTNLSILLSLNNDEFINYLYYYLKAANLRTLDSGAAQSQITIVSLEPFPIVTPDIQIIRKFNSLVEPLFKSIENLQNQNQRLREARDILLPRLMMGMIEV